MLLVRRGVSNSAYLQCVGEGIKKTGQLYAEYTLPDGWAWLFAPDELHVGHPRANPLAAPFLASRERETTSYLFTEAATALPRFAERMRKVGIATTGKGTIARVYAWLVKNMGKGYWFADTTELEWRSANPARATAFSDALTVECHLVLLGERVDLGERPSGVLREPAIVEQLHGPRAAIVTGSRFDALLVAAVFSNHGFCERVTTASALIV